MNVNVVGASLTDASMEATATTAGMRGGADDDYLENQGLIGSNATSSMTLSNVNVNIAGAAIGDLGNADTRAISKAFGMAGDGGLDTLINSGTVEAIANTNLITGSNASIGIFGYAGVSAKMSGSAAAIGMAGGDGGDLLMNSANATGDGEIVVRGNATATLASGTSFEFAGVAANDADINATASAIGIDGGWGESMLPAFADPEAAPRSLADAGNNTLLNETTLTVGSTASMTVGRNSTVIFGTSSTEATTNATAEAFGIVGDLARDTVENTGFVGVTSTASTNTNQASYAFAGGSSSDASLVADSLATGIATLSGNDIITNSADGVIEVSALANGTSTGGARATFGASTTSGRVGATTLGTGIDAGAGNDVLNNLGELRVTIHGTVSSTNNSDAGFIFGDAGAESGATADLRGFGVLLGEGDDTMLNQGILSVVLDDRAGPATVNARSDSNGGDITLDGDARSTSSALLTTSLTGIAGGDGDDWIVNEGELRVLNAPRVTAVSDADGDGLDGDGYGTANTSVGNADLPVTAVGIEGGAGNNRIFNSGEMNVTASPSGSARVVIDGDNAGDAYGVAATTVRGSAIGIRAEDGANEIINEGTLRVVATANATATSVVEAGWLGSAFETGNAAAVATAIGIEAGDGGNVIVNSELIDVSADAFASGTTFRTVVESAIAIRTGSGNDTIINEGTGEIVIRKNGGISAGTVIDAGAGDDIVRLLGSSLVRGDIELGEGNDMISFGGNGGFIGRIFGGNGIDTISIEDRRVLDFEPDAFRSIERLAVNQGTLRIGEDYTIVDSGGLRVELFDGGYGRLEIDGSAAISGDTGLEVIAAPRIYRDGETFDVMVGESLTGTFGSATLPTSLMIDSSLNYLPDTLQVELAVAPFRTFGRNPVQRAIGGYLDSIAPIVSRDLAATLGEWQFISDPGELTDVFESLNPGIYNSMTRATFDTGRDLNRLLGRRMRSVQPWEQSGLPGRVRLPAGFSSDESPVAAAPDPRARTGAWITGFHHWGSQDGHDGYNGYDQRSSGFSLGYDTFVNEHFLLGGALTYADSNIDLDGGMGDGDIEAISASLYGGWFTDRWWINGSASYGRQDYDVHRTTSPAIPGGSARSGYDGDLFSAALGGGIIFRLSENWRIEPFAGLEYLYLDEDGIRETGAGPTSLSSNGHRTDALYSELGIQLAGEIDCGSFTTLPFLGAAWVHDFGIDDQALNVGFTGAPGTSFTMPGFDVGADRLRIEVGVGFAVKNGLIQFGYMGEFGSGYDSHGLRASVGFSF